LVWHLWQCIEAARAYDNVPKYLYGDCTLLNLQLPSPLAVATGEGGGLAVVVSSPSLDIMVASPGGGGGGGHNHHQQYHQQ
jgi:hypothetical protein